MPNTDTNDAAEAMREIAHRRQQVGAEASRNPLPWWYVLSNAGAAWAVVASVDYEDSILIMAAGLAVAGVIATYSSQSSRVQPYRSGRTRSVRVAALVAVAVTFGVYCGAAVALRLAHVPLAHTLAGAAMAATAIAMTPWLRRTIRDSLNTGKG